MTSGAHIVHTVCMDTRDALRRKDGEFAFRLAGDNPRINAIKVGLGSLEFPMVQWSIEESSNLLYFSEGIVIDADRNALSLVEVSDAAAHEFACRCACVNEIVEISARAGDWKAIRTKTPTAHAVFRQRAQHRVRRRLGGVEIVCSSMGTESR